MIKYKVKQEKEGDGYMKVTITGKDLLNVPEFYDDEDEEEYEELTIVEHLLFALNCINYGDNRHNRIWSNVGTYCYRFILTREWNEDSYQWGMYDNVRYFEPNKTIRMDGVI